MSMDKVSRLERRACGRDPPGEEKNFSLLPVACGRGLWTWPANCDACLRAGPSLKNKNYLSLRAGGIRPALKCFVLLFSNTNLVACGRKHPMTPVLSARESVFTFWIIKK